MMLPSGLIHVSGNMPSPRSSVLSKFEVVIEYLKGGKSLVLSFWSGQRKEVPGSGVPAPSDQLPSESDYD